MRLKSLAAALALPALGLAFAAPASAYCGFYVAKADTDLFTDASNAGGS